MLNEKYLFHQNISCIFFSFTFPSVIWITRFKNFSWKFGLIHPQIFSSGFGVQLSKTIKIDYKSWNQILKRWNYYFRKNPIPLATPNRNIYHYTESLTEISKNTSYCECLRNMSIKIFEKLIWMNESQV